MKSTLSFVFLTLFLLATSTVTAQVSDDFTDGDFTNGTLWIGDDAFFTVDGGVLRSNIDPGDASINYYLSTANALIDDVQWEFWINLDFATSGANYADIYVMADDADLSAAANGYFIRFGDTADEISFYKLSSGSESILIDGPDGELGSSNNIYKVRLTRTAAGLWTLELDEDNTGVFTGAGSITDSDITTTGHFGIRIEQSGAASPVNNHFFDDIEIGPIPADEEAPELISVDVTSATELVLQFSEALEEASANNNANYFIDGGIGNPATALLEGGSPNTVNLTLPSALTNGQDYTVTVSGVADLAGNTTADETATFTFFIPDDPNPGDVIFNEIFPDPSPSVGLPESEYIEIYNRSTSFFDTEDWILVNSSVERVLPSVSFPPDSYLILCDASNVDSFTSFGTVIGITSFTALANTADSLTLIDGSGEILDIVSYTDNWYQDPNKDDGGYSLERINPILSCSRASNWAASNDPSGGTPGSQNSLFDNTPDLSPPDIVSVSISDPSTLLINLSEPLDEAGLAGATIELDQGIAILDFTLIQPDQIQVSLSSPLETGVSYLLSVEGLTDCEGNISSLETTEIFIGELPLPGDLIISEIMADPTPAVGLPESEYFELFNKSTKTLELQGSELSGVIFEESIIMQPGDYLAFASNSNSDLFQGFEDVRFLDMSTSFLTNGGTELILLNAEGEQLDFVDYSDDWYDDPDKDDGGYSLELINPTLTCSGSSNWAASNDPSGGTPGSQNSLFDDTPDTTPPSVTSVSVIDPLNLLLGVSEPLEDLNSASISLNQGISINEFSLVQDDQIQVLLVEPLQTGVGYELTVTGLVDCEGNASGTETLTIFIGEMPLPGDLIISEIMADPTPIVGLPEGEYFELFNKSNKTLELQGSELSGVAFEESVILQPGDYLAFASISNAELFANLEEIAFLDMSTSFLTNGGTELILLNAEGDQLDFVDYSDDWYDDPDKDDGGYSLELINPTLTCSGSSNWAASNDPSGGTPGMQNSIFDDTPDTTPATITSVSVIDPLELLLAISEPIEDLNATTIGLNQGISINEFSLAQADQIQVLLVEPLQTGVAYELTISGLVDCQGNASEPQAFPVFIGELPLPGDLIISEIMADPTPAVGLPEGEYFELFNKSTKTLELQGSELSGVIFEGSILMQPGEYLAFASNSNSDLFETLENVRFLDMSTSFLTNGGTELILLNAEGEQLDFVDYSDDWYNDPDKDDGGYSLELINPDAACSGAFNWSASDSPLGGTPGEQNSIFDDAPDQSAPTLVSFGIPQDNEVQLEFSEPLDEGSINDIVATFTPESDIAGIFQIQPDELLIELILPLEIGVTYSVQLTGVEDCAGNQAPAIELNILLGVMPEVNQILITEIMADPSPSVGLPEGEYFELYNSSEVAIDLLNCSLSGVEFEQSIVMAPGEYLFFASINNQVAFLTSPDVIFLENMSSTFLTNGGRELELVNPDGVTVDRVNYDISWYKDDEKEDGGYSLERINLSEPCRGADNWTGSEAEFGGTPGAENSVYSEEPDLTAPEIVAVYAQGSNLIEVRFSEVIDSLSVLLTDITVSPVVGVGAVFNDPPDYSSLLIQLSEPLEAGVRYELSLEGITDCVGNPIGVSESFVFALPQPGEPGDLLINEILFNPRTAGRDFVEIYNASDKNIGLENWVLQNAGLTTRVISEDPLVIFPGQHLVLTDDIGSTIQEYPMSGAYRENFHEMESLPSFNNGDGSVILADSLENEIDRFDYLEDYHFPLLNTFDGVSLERLSYTRPTNESGNWSSASERVGFATPGYVNSQFLPEGRASAQFELQDEVFSPDNDGFEDVLLINYTLDGPDYLATIRIYDRRGRLIRGLTNNLLLGTDGTLSWDGTTDDRSKARLGAHIILIEIFSPDGETKTFKIPCIVAGNLSN